MADSDSEEDYMTMVIEEAPKHESSIQRNARLRREREERSRIKPKAEREAEEEAARQAALQTALPSTNKGFKMMAKMGFKQGDALGKSENARKEPIEISAKDDKGGIGLESEKKRKFREQAEQVMREAKRSKEDEGDWRELQRQKTRETKFTKDLANAQRTAERLEQGETEDKNTTQVPLKSINVLWRSLARTRLERLRERRENLQLKNSLSSRLPSLATEDEDEDEDDKIALGRDTEVPVIEDELDEEDEEFENFQALPVEERLQEVADFMRKKHYYCFWCAFRYPDSAMDGCPGPTALAHEE